MGKIFNFIRLFFNQEEASYTPPFLQNLNKDIPRNEERREEISRRIQALWNSEVGNQEDRKF